MPRPTAHDQLRRLPAMDQLLAEPAVAELVSLYGRRLVRVQARRALDALRSRLDGGELPPERLAGELEALPRRLGEALEAAVGRPVRRVINATGVFLHTNLGRAPLPREVAAALPRLLDAYCDLEMDLYSGRRGDRNRRAEELLRALTGAGGALVANNNAAALVLVLATLARGREVVVSRGELVEIGGSFRIPDILRASGANLREVGTTNRTREEDYRQAIGPETALLLKVFPSNYRVTGFVESVPAAALARLAEERGLPLLVDEGSGLLRPSAAPQLAGHPSLSELLAAGCPLVCGSGDKVLGGPQAGLLVGRADLVAACKGNPLYRALRPDRAGLAALEAVLRLHLRDGRLPLDRMWPDAGEHRRRLEALAAELGAEIVPAEAFLGGGAAPERPLPGEALALPGKQALLRRLRTGEPSVVGYIKENRLLLDLRTVDPDDDRDLAAAVRRVLATGGGS